MKILENIREKEQSARLIVFCSMICLTVALIAGFITYSLKMNAIVEKTKGEVFILVDGLMVKAIRSNDYKSDIEASTKGSLLLFSNYFWSLEPYSEYINKNHQMAFDMADNSVKQLRLKLNKEDFYSDILASKYSTEFMANADDIQIDLSQKPYQFTINGKLKILRQKDFITHHLVAQGELEQRSNSDNNFTGFFIKNYKVTDFSVIQEETK